MSKEMCRRVIVIDDDEHNNHIVKVGLRHLCKPLVPRTEGFILPAEGVAYITRFLLSHDEPLILFLDINMPLLTGWDVLDKLSLLPGAAK